MNGAANPEEIAKSLSKTQRRLMVGDTRFVRWATYRKLIELGLLYQVGGFVNRTPLGRAVRSILIGEQP